MILIGPYLQCEKVSYKNCFFLQTGQLTEAEIIALGKSLKLEFPSGKMSKPQTKEIVGKLFPR